MISDIRIDRIVTIATLRTYVNMVVAPRLILMITKQIEGIQTIEKVLMLFKGKIVISLKS